MRLAGVVLVLLGCAACAKGAGDSPDGGGGSPDVVDAAPRADAAATGCGPASCDGCCAPDGECVGGEEAEACGSDGAACVACGDGFACEERACTVPGDSRWTLVLVSGEVSETDCDPDGRWDDGTNPPDPYLEVVVGALEPSFTGVADDTLTPEWNDSVAAGAAAELKASGISLTARDDDSNPDDPIGSCDFAIADQDFDTPLDLDCARDCSIANSGFTVRARLAPRP